MNLYIDCTDLPNIDSNTGIQRTQRNIISNILALSNSHGIDCHTIVNIVKNKFIKVNNLLSDFNSLQNYFYMVYLGLHQPWRFLRLTKIIFPNKIFLSFIERLWNKGYGRYLFIPLSFMMIPFIIVSILYYKLSSSYDIVLPSQNDIFLVCGASLWDMKLISSMHHMRSRGVKIVTLIYDIIPIDFPELCSKSLVSNFKKCLPYIYKYSDIILTDSHYTKSSIERNVSDLSLSISAEIIPIQFGIDLDKVLINPAVRLLVKEPFTGDFPVYLAVGTVEPRKNYSFLLEAFDKLWETTPDVALCIVGHYGWNMEKFRKTLIGHPRFGKTLFWFPELSDAELEFCYRHAKALVYPSKVEGLGLPLLEALRYGCPVLASDIPVFREVGGDNCAYFSLQSFECLSEAIRRIEDSSEDGALKRVENFKWITWEKTAADILDIFRSRLKGSKG